jgi:hypothetical protein
MNFILTTKDLYPIFFFFMKKRNKWTETIQNITSSEQNISNVKKIVEIIGAIILTSLF